MDYPLESVGIDKISMQLLNFLDADEADGADIK